ncbi:MAG TPA: hypothetical protein VLF39_02865 [Candidatus Saccharimonadales bacterium]|nr:hypothetical protein [Candidatus Saccharimonadales bacterium]
MRKEELRYPNSPNAPAIKTILELNHRHAEKLFDVLGTEFEPIDIVYLVEGGGRITATELDRLPIEIVDASILSRPREES